MLSAQTTHARVSFTSALIAIAVFCAFAIAMSIAPVAANAAISATASISNTSNQAAAHPNTTVTVTPSGDKIRDLVMVAAPGILGNPESVAIKCTSAQFLADTCPPASQVGTSSSSVVLLFTLTVNGTIYALEPDATDAATLGIILRPPLGLAKIKLQAHVKIRPTDGGLNISVPGIPNKLGTSNITVKNLKFVFNGRSGASTTTGPYFNNTPHNCTIATSTLQVTSHVNTTGSASASYTPTGCPTVPFAGTLTTNVSNQLAGAPTAISGTFVASTADAVTQNSYVRTLTMTLPNGTGINFPNLNAVPGLCTSAQLAIDGCPAGADIGDVSTTIPFLPPTSTGDIYLTGRSSQITFGVVVRGVRGQKLIVPGGSATAVDLNSDDIADAIRASIVNLPQVPSSSTTVSFITPLINNPATCGTNTITSTLLGWSGASLPQATTYSTTGC